MQDNPRKVVVKTMTVTRGVDDVFDFFEDVKKSMEVGRASKAVAKGSDGWGAFDHVVAGKAKMNHEPVRQAGVLDHIFVGGGLTWKVYIRIIPNQSGSTVVWAFMRPDGLIDEQFESQLNTGFDREIALWKKALKSGRN